MQRHGEITFDLVHSLDQGYGGATLSNDESGMPRQTSGASCFAGRFDSQRFDGVLDAEAVQAPRPPPGVHSWLVRRRQKG